jgi:2-C-methyl-D-erythritol 4-phosphate cytidylyltransferase
MWREIADSFRLSKFIYTVSGKENRQSSVFAGIKAAVGNGAKDLIIAIHDGARPLASEEIFTEAIEAADFYGGAVAAIPVRDTVKKVKDGVIAATPDRNAYYLAQTPQVFRAELLLKAYTAAMAEGFTSTDDASLAERVGGIVKITKGSHRNIKITAPEDIAIAETLIHKP